MRRVASYFLFIVGGYFLSMQVFIGLGLLDIYPGVGDDLARLAWFMAVALPFLLLGTWLSPGERWRELGRTLLIGTGVALFAFTTVIFPPGLPGGPGLAPYAADLTWAAGIPNLLLVGGAGGLLLYRNGAGRRRSAPGAMLRRGAAAVSASVSTQLRASLAAMRRRQGPK
jgi:hypothetical protein